MTEEQNVTIETKEEHKCFCQSKGFRKFLVIALGTFVGVYSALCLFAALHRPIMPPPGFGAPQFGMRHGCPCRMVEHKHHHHFDKGQKPDRGDFQRYDKGQKQPAPFQEDKDD